MSLDNPSVSGQCAEYFNEVTILQAFKYTTNPSATGCLKIIAVMTYPRVDVNQISSWTVPLIFDHWLIGRQDSRKNAYIEFVLY
jgi:hypothetical protein